MGFTLQRRVALLDNRRWIPLNCGRMGEEEEQEVICYRIGDSLNGVKLVAPLVD